MIISLTAYPKLQDFFTLYKGLIIEAFPFVIIGVLVSVIVALFVDEEKLLKIIPRNKILSHGIFSLLGVFMPVCECGNVPVVRRLLGKKFDVSHAVTFLLAAPILNPITFLSTWVAFGFDHRIVYIRLIAAFIISNSIGILISYKKNQNDFLTERFYQEVVCEHHHGSKIEQAFEIFFKEFIEVMSMLAIGAFFAAISQTFIPRGYIESIGSSPIMSVIAMIIMAFVISICANVDAFFALSYANIFSTGSILSFLVFGPMVDIKILTMLRTTFKPKLLFIIVGLVTMMSFILGLTVNYFM